MAMTRFRREDKKCLNMASFYAYLYLNNRSPWNSSRLIWSKIPKEP